MATKPQLRKRSGVVVKARGLKEWDRLRRKYPKVNVKLDGSNNDQTQLFDTEELVDV